MVSKITSLLFICAFGAINCRPMMFYEAGNANLFVDQILATLKTSMNATIDPFHIPDQYFNFTKKVALTTWHGEANLTEGAITGLSHLRRSGDSDIGTENEHFIAHIQLGDDNVNANFKASLKLNSMHAHVTLNAKIGNIDVKATVGADADGKPELKELNVDELKHVSFQVHGLSILDPLVDVIADGFVAIFNPQARSLISNLLKDLIGKEIKNLKLPGTK